ncbi:MAG TPA: hypothetical protein VFW40_08315 [Capsulimonadaceae bacterium]|nr:hypothetical protein [Capsulimonadaceae bacterium]
MQHDIDSAALFAPAVLTVRAGAALEMMIFAVMIRSRGFCARLIVAPGLRCAYSGLRPLPAIDRSLEAVMTDEEKDQFERNFAAAKEIMQRLSQNLPEFIEVAAIGVRSKAPYQLLAVRAALIWRTEELARNACNSLECDDLAVAAILTRSITENAALTWKLKDILERRVGKSPEELNTALMRALAGSTTWEEGPAPYNVLSCLDTLTKTIDGARQTYESLSEFAHPNWRGVMGLYSKTDREKFITYFGHNLGGAPAKCQITTALCAALGIFEYAYKAITEAMPRWISELEPL